MGGEEGVHMVVVVVVGSAAGNTAEPLNPMGI